VLHESECIEECPLKYESQSGVCVEVGLVCPANFELSEDQTACIPTQLTCEEGFELNGAGRCVPNDSSIVPFPFLMILFCLTLVVIAGKIKDRNNCRFIANLVALYGLVEPILMLTFLI
jgi:hypothetical protein